MATLNNSYIPESRSDQTLLLLSKVKTLKKQKLITLIGFSRSFRLLLLPSPHRFAQDFFDQKKINFKFCDKKIFFLLARAVWLEWTFFRRCRSKASSSAFTSATVEVAADVQTGFRRPKRRQSCESNCAKKFRDVRPSAFFFPSWFWERILTP